MWKRARGWPGRLPRASSLPSQAMTCCTGGTRNRAKRGAARSRAAPSSPCGGPADLKPAPALLRLIAVALGLLAGAPQAAWAQGGSLENAVKAAFLTKFG